MVNESAGQNIVYLGRLLLMPVLLSMLAACSRSPISPDLELLLNQRSSSDQIDVIVSLSPQVNVDSYLDAAKAQGPSELLSALKSNARDTQVGVRRLISARNIRNVKDLWLINSLALSASPAVIRELAKLPDVGTIRPDAVLQAPVVTLGVGGGTPEWNLSLINAPALWALAYDGNGIVVASMDSGVDVTHPDLAGRWRGGSNSWYDPHNEHPVVPYDKTGHGTQVMGLMVGGNAGGTAIGVAPGARWIAAKIYDDTGAAQMSDIHLSFQWLLDPDGDSNTADAPDLVNGSWGMPASANLCDTEFAPDIHALRVAGIGTVFSAGNEGPTTPSSISPANNAESFSVGAIDTFLAIGNFSSRGPAPAITGCGGGIYPRLTAPGVNVTSSDLVVGGIPTYAVVSGTSYAAPHVTAAMALLRQAFPQLDLPVLELAVLRSAVDLGISGADNVYGYGQLDVLAAYQLLTSNRPLAADDSYVVTEGAAYDQPAPGVLANDSSFPVGRSLFATLVGPPAHGALSLMSSGGFSYVPAAGYTGADSFSYQVSDGSQTSSPAMVNISVITDLPPQAVDDDAAMQVRVSRRMVAKNIPVLANDTDPDSLIDPATITIVNRPDHGGTVVIGGNGVIGYTPKVYFTGTEAFSYAVRDYQGKVSNAANVRVVVGN